VVVYDAVGLVRFVTIGYILRVFGFFAGEKIECGER
jgi:hypothetical protein